MFQDSEVEMQDRVGALETAVNDAVDHGLQPECAKMLRDIVFCVFRAHASVKYTEVFFAGSYKFPTKEVVRGE